MSFAIVCNMCGLDLEDPGAIVLSPPDEQGRCRKGHVCTPCYIEHYVTFTDDRFTVEHSLECRMGGNMNHCAYHGAIARHAELRDDIRGRYRAVLEDHGDITHLTLEPTW